MINKKQWRLLESSRPNLFQTFMKEIIRKMATLKTEWQSDDYGGKLKRFKRRGPFGIPTMLSGSSLSFDRA